MELKTRMAKYLYERFNYVYCNDCKYQDYVDDVCDYCHRKNMNWALSEDEAEKIAEVLVDMTH